MKIFPTLLFCAVFLGCAEEKQNPKSTDGVDHKAQILQTLAPSGSGTFESESGYFKIDNEGSVEQIFVFKKKNPKIEETFNKLFEGEIEQNTAADIVKNEKVHLECKVEMKGKITEVDARFEHKSIEIEVSELISESISGEVYDDTCKKWVESISKGIYWKVSKISADRIEIYNIELTTGDILIRVDESNGTDIDNN